MPLTPINEYILIKRGQKSPLQFTYAGPYSVLHYNDKKATVNYQGKPYLVSRDRIKPIAIPEHSVCCPNSQDLRYEVVFVWGFFSTFLGRIPMFGV